MALQKVQVGEGDISLGRKGGVQIEKDSESGGRLVRLEIHLQVRPEKGGGSRAHCGQSRRSAWFSWHRR